MNPVERLLDDIRESLRVLGLEPRVDMDPRVAAVFLIAPVFVLALTSSITILLAALPITLTLYIYSASRLRVLSLSMKLIAYPILLAAVSAAPLIILGRLHEAIIFILRVVNPALYMMGFTLLAGWRRIIQGLEELHVPRPLTRGMLMLAYHLPRFTGQLLAIILARRARTLRKPSRGEWWRILASSTGELLLRSQHAALMLHYAIEARTLHR